MKRHPAAQIRSHKKIFHLAMASHWAALSSRASLIATFSSFVCSCILQGCISSYGEAACVAFKVNLHLLCFEWLVLIGY